MGANWQEHVNKITLTVFVLMGILLEMQNYKCNRMSKDTAQTGAMTTKLMVGSSSMIEFL